jgi:hypothetical protein
LFREAFSNRGSIEREKERKGKKGTTYAKARMLLKLVGTAPEVFPNISVLRSEFPSVGNTEGKKRRVVMPEVLRVLARTARCSAQ